MKLIVALGNPGSDYALTRHNAGWMLLDRWLGSHGVNPAAGKNRFQGAFFDNRIKDNRVMALKPMQFMNRSGGGVQEAIHYYKLDAKEDLLVLVDDLATDCGSIKLKPKGGAGGHNGLKDIQRCLGTQDYPRLRIGIDPRGQIPQVNYVLGRFTPQQQDSLEDALNIGCAALNTWLTEGLSAAMNRFNA